MEGGWAGNEHSGPTPRGRDDSAASIEVERVLKSTNASILRMFGDIGRVLSWVGLSSPSSSKDATLSYARVG